MRDQWVLFVPSDVKIRVNQILITSYCDIHGLNEYLPKKNGLILFCKSSTLHFFSLPDRVRVGTLFSNKPFHSVLMYK